MNNSSKPQNIKVIYVTGDLIRPDNTNKKSLHYHSIRWLYEILGPIINEATGLNVCIADDRAKHLSIGKLHALSGNDVNLSNWARLFHALPGPLSNHLQGVFDQSLVVGFELSPSMCRSFRDAGIPYVDCQVHPVRFMDDLLLAMRASFPDGENVLSRYALDERLVRRAAGLVKAHVVRNRALQPRFDGVLPLFVAQTMTDRSMIVEDRLMCRDDFTRLLSEIRDDLRSIAYKPHPYEQNADLMNAVKDISVDFFSVNTNIYGLLASDHIEKVITLSSSVGVEAPYFGKSTHYLLGPSVPVQFAGDNPDDAFGFWTIRDDFLMPDFWRDLLAPILTVTPHDGDRPDRVPNRLRASLRSYWGYEPFANDVVLEQSSYRNGGLSIVLSRRMKKALTIGEIVLNKPVRAWVPSIRDVMRHRND